MLDSPAPLRRALVSVSDKANLGRLAELLVAHRVEVLSTGGTAKALRGFGVEVVQVDEYTGAPEILGGRVKTLHPRIHGGILAMPTPEHVEELRRHDIPPIDLVVVNLYPFQETIAEPNCTFADAVENIDVGGPTLVRAAAKNWQRTTVIVEPKDYDRLAAELASGLGGTRDAFRLEMARKAFAHTAAYDLAIARYIAEQSAQESVSRVPGEDVGPFFGVALSESTVLRYGENPHQKARLFTIGAGSGGPVGIDQARQLQGKELSYNNLLDLDAALGTVLDVSVLGPGAVVVKHLSPCGVAVGRHGETPAELYVRAREADAESAFGGIVALGSPVDQDVARKLVETFLECVVAPSFTKQALEVLSSKKNLRLLELPTLREGQERPLGLRVRSIAGGLLVQTEDRVRVRPDKARLVTRQAPTPAQIADLDLAQRVAKHVRSNAIVIVKDGVTVGIGGGQTSRVEAVRQAVGRARRHAEGAALASDAFFPFRDGLDEAAQGGVRAVIQPGGSLRDEEVIRAADEHGLAMVFTDERHFRH